MERDSKYKPGYLRIKYGFLFPLFSSVCILSQAQKPNIKVDINMEGRKETEVNYLNIQPGANIHVLDCPATLSKQLYFLRFVDKNSNIVLENKRVIKI